jgi:hypothetical protein
MFLSIGRLLLPDATTPPPHRCSSLQAMLSRGAALQFDELLSKKAVALALLEPAPHKSVSFSAFDRYESDRWGALVYRYREGPIPIRRPLL